MRSTLVTFRHALVAMALILTTATGAQAQERTFGIGTAPAGGFLYPLGGAIARAIEDNVAGVSVTAEATSGAVDNLKLTASDPTYLGFARNDTAYDAVNGLNRFDGNPQPVTALAALVPSFLLLATTTDTGVETVEDLKGRRVSTNLPGTGLEDSALRTISVAGLDPENDISREKLSIADSIDALRDGKIDAFFIVTSAKSQPLLDLAATPGLTLKLIPLDGYATKLNAVMGPVHTESKIPMGTYPGVDMDVTAPTTWTMLVANTALSDEDAYAFTKAIFESKSQIAMVVSDIAALDIADQVITNTGIAFHPGALRYYRENGLAAD